MESFRSLFEECIQKNSVKMKSKIKLNFKHLFELAKMEYGECNIFFLIPPNVTVCKFNNFKIGILNEVQRNLSSYTKWVSKLKVRFY